MGHILTQMPATEQALAVIEQAIEDIPVVVPSGRRFLDARAAQLTLVENDRERLLSGYAAPFNRTSLVMLDVFAGPFREQIAPGAFKRSLANSDIVALWQHDSSLPLARTSAGNLTLREDDYGLKADIRLGDTSWARDAYEAVKAGLVRNMSFAFSPVRWQDDPSTKPLTRTLLEVRLHEVSAVTFPAYPDTSIGARALLTESGLDIDALSRVIVRARRGEELRRYELNLIDEVHALLTSLRRSSDPATGHSETVAAAPDPATGHSEQAGDAEATIETPTAARQAGPVLIDADRAARLRARLTAAARI